ncbi:MAG: diacylglycerol kinase family lipid kinase [Bacteroides sp.]|nr:diacylglycerol kinase family lipid kinase [Bacteroides sp.]
MKKIIFIINPKSGTQNKESIISQIDEIIDSDRFSWETVTTEYAGHATEIAAEAVVNNVDIVVAIGGDGTINEVARSLVHTNTALAIIPSGSGNGFSRHLQIPMETKKALDIINTGTIELVDYGKINGTSFFCTCGVGFDAFVSLKFAEAGKRGMLTYLEKTLQESLNYQPETYELETEDGTVKYKAFLIACGNASQYGNNAYIAPQATITDGLLDVTILEPFTVLDVPSLAFQLFNKTIDHNSRIKTFRCKNLHIHRNSQGVVHFDGDPMMTGNDIYVEVIKEGLYVVTPQVKRNTPSNVLHRASDYINILRTLNDAIVGDITQRNKDLIKKFTKKE